MLSKIKTREYGKAEIERISRMVAEETGEEWVAADRIEAYNRSLDIKECGPLRKVFWFIVNDHPLIGLTICTLMFSIIIGIIGCIISGSVLSITIWMLLGAIPGWFVGSFLYPGLVKNCNVCRSMRKCDQVFEYTLSHSDHTEHRKENDTTTVKVRVSDQLVFAVMECRKCGGRKIEILAVTKEILL